MTVATGRDTYMRMTLNLAAILSLAAMAAPAMAAGATIPSYVAAAVASPLRDARDRARDDGNRPAEVLAFSGVKPGDRVADFWPTPPYSTGLLSGVVGPSGRVYAIVPPKLFKDVPRAEPVVKAGLAVFPNVTLIVQAFDAFSVPEKLDVVWLGKVYHDFPNSAEMGPLDIAGVNRAIFKALKPGGTLIVVDHAARRGSGFRDTEPDDAKRLHRIDPAVVKADMAAAGFRLVAESALLANPADDHTKSPFDPALRNHTDRFLLKFRKPGG